MTKFKRERAFVIMVKIICYSILTLFVAFCFFDGLLNETLANYVSDYDAVLWYKSMQYKLPIVLVVYTIIIAIISFIVVTSENRDMDTMFDSIESILEHPDDKISLPKKLELLEIELNKIRLHLAESRSRAKEEENKKNDLILYMAHDLKTPLTSVIGYLTLLKEEKKISTDIRNKYIGIALDKALRVEELTNEFFEITRYNLHEMQLKKSSLNLTLLINQLMEECYPMLQEKKLTLNFQAKEKVQYYGDGNLLARAFGNVIKNAMNYSNENSTIEISIQEQKDRLKFIFKNEGEKIPEYKIEKLFEKFYRGDESRTSKTGGSGVGLSITKDIIELHGGTIEVQNEEPFIVFTIVLYK